MIEPTVEANALAGRAVSLWERLADHDEGAPPGDLPAEHVDRRVKRWQHVVGKGDAQAFQRRLEWDGLTRARVEAALARADAPVPPPPWMDVFADLVASIDANRSQPTAAVARDRARPFEHLLRPLVRAARVRLSRTLERGAPMPKPVLSDDAYRSLELGLMDRLGRICGPSLQAQFSAFRPAGHGLLNALVGATNGASTRHYDAFVVRWLSLRLMPLFEEYPVLARLVALVVDDWVAFCAEFHAHLQQDAASIEESFRMAPGSLGDVVDLRYGLSDSHRHGRCVVRVTFAGGLTLAYKPRSLGIDRAFEALVGWCGRRGLSLDLRHARSLDRCDHGWMEWLDQRACPEAGAVGRFYRRAGMMLALLHALRGTDCHHENVVAHGEHPVLVDLETLMVPELDSTREPPNEETFWQSVVRTGMLPRWETQLDPTTAYDISALGGIGPQETPAQVARWRCVNTDDMDVYYEPFTLPPRANELVLDGAVVSPADHASDLVDGFREMYRLLSRHREALLAVDGPLAAFRRQSIRFVVRPTEQYGLVLRRSYAPDHLRNGCDRSIELDHLSRGHFGDAEPTGASALLAAELRALEQLDIPRFAVLADETTIRWDGREIAPRFFARSGYSRAAERIGSLGEADLAAQTRIVEASLHAWRSRCDAHVGVEEPQRTAPGSRDRASSDAAAPGPRDFLAEATAIADVIASSALQNQDDSLSWVGLSRLPTIARHQLQPVGEGLYDGRCGIALFLAACDRVQRSTTYRSTAERALRPLRARLRRSELSRGDGFVRNVGIGMAQGVGGLVYALSCIGEWWHDSTLLDDAELLARAVPLDAIESDLHLDVIGGAAGAGLGLLKLYRVRASTEILGLAQACAERLCRHQHTCGEYAGAWDSAVASRPLTGFSHGASGIAYALVQLHAVTCEPRLLAAAQKAVEFERTAFVAAAGNWMDFRRRDAGTAPSFATSWCHGAPGIALARLALSRDLHTAAMAADVEAALRTTRQAPWQTVDHLCCGNFGRVEILLHAAGVLERSDLAGEAAALVLGAQRRPGAFRTFPTDVPEIARPGYFDGLAGIGYVMLRLAAPGALPSVLAFE